MGTALPFSQVRQFLKSQNEPISGCLIDTQLLVATLYDPHPFYEDSHFLFDQIADFEVPIFTTVTTRSEFIDINRRIIMTEALLDMLSKDSKWRLTSSSRSKIQTQKQWIDSEARNDRMPILNDNRIKQCKKVFFAKTQSGKDGWLTICDHVLKGKLEETWDTIQNDLAINHLEIRKGDNNPHIISKVKWTDMYKLSESSCLSSSDAMIVNMFQNSTFPFIASADFDMAYSILTTPSISKTIFVPDKMYKDVKRIR